MLIKKIVLFKNRITYSIKLFKNILPNKDKRKLYFLATKEIAPFSPLSNSVHIDLILNWFKSAQIAADDGGIPAKYRVIESDLSSLYPSYPETSGYILSSLITYSKNFKSPPVKIIDLYNFLLSCQLDNGSFPGGHKRMSNNSKPSYFNTGQILLGLVSYNKNVNETEAGKSIIKKTLDWMTDQINTDGSIKDSSTFRGFRSYYSRATYGALSAAKYLNDQESLTIISQNFECILNNFTKYNSISKWGFQDNWSVLHGIAYTLRGLTEYGIQTQNQNSIDKCILAISELKKHKTTWAHSSFIPSHYSDDFSKHDNEICPTGLAQLALVLYKLGQYLNKADYKDWAQEITQNLKCYHLRDFDNIYLNGTLPGSWPINGGYQSMDLVNWSIKFFLDCLMIEEGLDPNLIEG